MDLGRLAQVSRRVTEVCQVCGEPASHGCPLANLRKGRTDTADENRQGSRSAFAPALAASQGRGVSSQRATRLRQFAARNCFVPLRRGAE